MAAWCIGGDEAAGTLELLLANPVDRVRVALERAGAMVVLLATLTLVSGLVLAALAGPVGPASGVSPARIVEATAWRSWVLPLAVSLVLVLAGSAVFSRRDLR